MEIFLGLLLLAAVAACAYFALMLRRETVRSDELRAAGEQELASADALRKELEAKLRRAQSELGRLAKWESVDNAVEKARELLASAEAKLRTAESDAAQRISRASEEANRLLSAATDAAAARSAEARFEAKRLADEARAVLARAAADSARIIADANAKAEEIAGKAFDVVKNVDLYERTARAMKNVIEGYGDEYLKPAASLLDDLAEDFAHKDAGRQLKLAREHTKELIKTGQAAKCEYVEASRREGAEHFVLDAFNGKIDSILSRVRHDNFGKLEQEIKDAFTLVNYGGRAFREARITEEYLQARAAELKWATIAQELKRREQDEQREFREWIREEQKAQREFEKAMREAAREEEVLRKAMAHAQAKMEAASEAQRAQFESQLAALNEKLKEAEERNQRALSMAQQTRRGHVYIISNVGSFGQQVYKVGLTRRLEPLDRIRELGDASVPFEFDVHALILSDDAPALETRLHKLFLLNQINKVNHRKEFFRLSLADLRREIEALGVEAKWTMVAEARQYRETLAIENAIRVDPAAREAWINRQLTLDPVEPKEMTSDDADQTAPLGSVGR